MTDKETMAIIKQMVADGQISQEVAEKYFPELKEKSGDEKIRKHLINYFKHKMDDTLEYWEGIAKEDALAWLEKQGEHTKFRDSIQVGDKVTRNKDGVLVNLSQLNRVAKPNESKQGEKNPAMIQWKGDNLREIIDFTGCSPRFGEWFKTWEDYEKYVHSHNNIFKIFNEDGSHMEIPVGSWIIKAPDGYNTASRFGFVPKPAWSEEDEKISKAIIKRINGESDSLSVDLSSAICWIENVKDRIQPQPKQEWSEEDEVTLDLLVDYLLDTIKKMPAEEYACGLGKAVVLLKSIKERAQPQSQWKPTEEQMKALRAARSIDGVNHVVLASLIYDLEKLMK